MFTFGKITIIIPCKVLTVHAAFIYYYSDLALRLFLLPLR